MMIRFCCAVLIVMFSSATGAAAQEAQQEQAIRLFLDCQADCDFDYLRREITFVSYVRDRTDAQVHLLITAQATGGGGRRYTLNFIGNRDFGGVSDTLFYNAAQRDTDDRRRVGLARTIKMGLMRFVATSPLASGIVIQYTAPETGVVEPTEPGTDPWDYWVFRFNGNGNVGGEALRGNYSMNGTFTANRTTEDWKFNFRLFGRYQESRTTLEDSTEYINTSRDYNSNTLVVKSLGPRLSVGAQINANSSIFSNEQISVRVAPAIEYNIYPYAQSTRRQLSILYTVGVRRVNYHEETIYFKTAETLSSESLELSYGVRQPWGDAGMSVTGSHYFHNTGLYRLQFDAGVDVQLFRGLSLNFGGDYSRIHDQLALRRRDATDEELLVQRQQLRTSYRYAARIGLSYSFGSIFNNVVNPRMSL